MKNVSLAIVNSSDNKNPEFTVNLRDLVIPLGEEFKRIKVKFTAYTLAFTKTKNELTYKSSTYINQSNNRKVDSFVMTEALAKSFCVNVDKVRGLDYIEALESKAKEADALRVQLLEAKILKLESTKPKLIMKRSTVNRVEAHNIREDLHNVKGYCDHITEVTIHHYYPVNEAGVAAGYENMGKGRHKTINIYK
jgi:hypothetical protein